PRNPHNPRLFLYWVRLQCDVLDAPVLRFAHIHFVLARASQLMGPIELADFLAGRSKPALHVAFEINLIDLSAGVCAVEELLSLGIGRSDTDCPRRTHV